MRILLVEDSRRLRESIVLALRRSGYAVDATGDGLEGLEMAEDHPYDAAILDIMLPSLDGISILKKLRAGGNRTPVMFLTARDAIEDRVAGLRGGADDYLVKPFALEELLARIEAGDTAHFASWIPSATVGLTRSTKAADFATRTAPPLRGVARSSRGGTSTWPSSSSTEPEQRWR